ncbi:MAG: BlaI/MecI/CopY family transcriptional regulator [Oscillospiraceae bacterium]|nr:BlaI/MecI/CopY family transcriptional regulator [Oscillospiraceae bacterium]
MENKENHVTPTEWHLMECLWEIGPCTGREAVEYLTRHVGWSRSTTLTLLRRMTEKGFVRCEDQQGLKTYWAALHREDAVRQETDSFLNRVYHGSLSQMLVALTKKTPLSRQEINELYAILKNAEEGQHHD